MMTFDSVFEKVKTKFPAVEKEDVKPDAAIKVKPEDIRKILTYLRDELQFETLGCLSGVDYPALPSYCVVYHPQSYTHKLIVALKVYLPRQDGVKLPTVSDIYKAANWLERETYDLMGIHFENHPELLRMFMPQDWVGHPLRKDFVTPDYYVGMPVPLYFEATEGGPESTHNGGTQNA